MLHKKRGRPRSLILKVYREHFEDSSRRTLYYRAALDRVRVAMVEAGVLDKADATHAMFERHPIPLWVMYEIGKTSRSDAEVKWLAKVSLDRRRRGWTTAQLLWWIREACDSPRPSVGR